MTKRTLTLLLSLILLFSLTTAAFAVEEEVLPCEGDQVAGTLVDFDRKPIRPPSIPVKGCVP